MDCTSLLSNNDPCPHQANHVIAVPMLSGRAVFVAPYCDEHADQQREYGGVAACGPALSEEVQPFEGLHS